MWSSTRSNVQLTLAVTATLCAAPAVRQSNANSIVSVRIIASDLNPPAIWEIMGMKGWVPTIELTTHVRNTPESGPFRVRATSCHLEGGFLEEDATVYDGTGRLIVQSRQLACYTSGS